MLTSIFQAQFLSRKQQTKEVLYLNKVNLSLTFTHIHKGIKPTTVKWFISSVSLLFACVIVQRWCDCLSSGIIGMNEV